MTALQVAARVVLLLAAWVSVFLFFGTVYYGRSRDNIVILSAAIVATVITGFLFAALFWSKS